MTTNRTNRLRDLIERINRIHRRRRLTGRPTAHLHTRSRSITAAYLNSTRQDSDNL